MSSLLIFSMDCIDYKHSKNTEYLYVLLACCYTRARFDRNLKLFELLRGKGLTIMGMLLLFYELTKIHNKPTLKNIFR